MKRHKGFRVQFRVMAGICLVMVLLNILARCSRSFSDWYTAAIFPIVSNIWSRISGTVPFSLGELLIVLGILLLLLTPVSLLVLLLLCKGKRPKILKLYGAVYSWIFTWILTTETLHCFIQYQCTPFGEQYFPDAPDSYSADEVLTVYAQLIESANAAAEEIRRDEDGYFIMTDDLQQEAKLAMQRLGESYPQFSGYYPDAKPIFFSNIMTQQWLLGIYFPFTMEVNYNTAVYPVNLPSTICHEFTHLKGNILEDEANFLAFLACIGSDSADFRYSGYLSALEYMMDVIYDIEGSEVLTAQISQGVWMDLYTFVPEDCWTEIEQQQVIDAAIVEEVSDIAMDTTLKLNGVEDGKKSYCRMVNLLLDYYLNESGKEVQ